MEDSRLVPIIEEIRRKLKEGIVIEDKINPLLKLKDIDLLKTKFPPCIQQLHNELVLTYHLKHQKRLFYSLFLKTYGFPQQVLLEHMQKRSDIDNPKIIYILNYSY